MKILKLDMNKMDEHDFAEMLQKADPDVGAMLGLLECFYDMFCQSLKFSAALNQHASRNNPEFLDIFIQGMKRAGNELPMSPDDMISMMGKLKTSDLSAPPSIH